MNLKTIQFHVNLSKWANFSLIKKLTKKENLDLFLKHFFSCSLIYIVSKLQKEK